MKTTTSFILPFRNQIQLLLPQIVTFGLTGHKAESYDVKWQSSLMMIALMLQRKIGRLLKKLMRCRRCGELHTTFEVSLVSQGEMNLKPYLRDIILPH